MKKKKPNSFWLFWQHCLWLSWISWNCFSVQQWKSKSLFITIFWHSRPRAPLQIQVGTSWWKPRGKDWSTGISFLWDLRPPFSSTLLVFPLPTYFSGTQWLHSFWGHSLCHAPHRNVPNTEYTSNQTCFPSCPFRARLGERLADIIPMVFMNDNA